MMRFVIAAFVAFLATGAAAETASTPIRFSHHASERLEERHIQRAWVEHVVHMPDWTEPDPQHKPSVHVAFGRIGEAKDQILHVVYADVDGAELVITEFFDRAAARRAPRQ
jgi:uncharacterized protein DUF4258